MVCGFGAGVRLDGVVEGEVGAVGVLDAALMYGDDEVSGAAQDVLNGLVQWDEGTDRRDHDGNLCEVVGVRGGVMTAGARVLSAVLLALVQAGSAGRTAPPRTRLGYA